MMFSRTLLISAALAFVPALANGQTGPDAGVQVPHHRPEVRRVSDSLNDSTRAVRICLDECLSSRPDLREGVCSGERPDLSQCFGSGTPACDLAAAAVDTGTAMIASARRRCEEPAPAAAPAPAPAAAVRAAPTEADREAAQRRREQRADAQCASSGPLRGMCRRCYLGGDRRSWVDGPIAPSVIRMAARRTDALPPTDAEEFAYRCQNTDTAMLTAVVGRLGTMFEGHDNRLRGVEHDVADITLHGTAPSVTMVQLLAHVNRAIQRLDAQHHLDLAQRAYEEACVTRSQMAPAERETDRVCLQRRTDFAAAEREYLPVIRATQGDDRIGIGEMIQRLQTVAQACTIDPNGSTTACLVAQQRLDEIARQSPAPPAPGTVQPSDVAPLPPPAVLVRHQVSAGAAHQPPPRAAYPLLEGEDGAEQP